MSVERKKQIVFDLSFIGDKRISGVERFALEIYKKLECSDELDIIAILPKGFLEQNRQIHTICLSSKSKILNHVFLFPMLIAKLKPDIVFLPSFPPSPMFILLKKCKFIRVLHDTVYWDKPKTLSLKAKVYLKPLDTFWIKRYEKIVTVSNYSKTRLCKVFGLNEESISIVPNGVTDLINNPNCARRYTSGKYILSVGTIEPRKNYEFLIDVFGTIANDCPDVSLVICGRKGWGYEYLSSKIDSSQFRHRIKLITDASDADLNLLYEECSLFVCSSLEEGFGIPIIEAMSKGKIVIAADNSGITEVVNSAGILVPGFEIDVWSKAIVNVLNRNIENETLHDRALLNAKKYSWSNSAKKILTVFQEVCFP
jgi:glycosyltransferase involved in cell wall biosynthesis